MNQNESPANEIKQKVIEAIRMVAPEVDFSGVDPALPLRDQIDIDSFDFLKIVVNIHKLFNVDVPEKDYSKLTTINSFVDYLKPLASF